MDLVAGVHWLHENLRAFGGDPERVSLLGHGTGAALANFLAVSPMAKGKTIPRVKRRSHLSAGASAPLVSAPLGRAVRSMSGRGSMERGSSRG